MTDTTSTTSIPEPLGQRRLREIRDALADQQQSAGETDAASAPVVKPGDLVHVLETGMSIATTASLWGGSPSLQLVRGQTFAVTAEMIEASRDRHGNVTWPAMVHDEDAQLRRWGAVRMRPGAAPEDLEPWVRGDSAWSEAREVARREAWARPTEQERRDALAEVNLRFGPAPTTSTITAVIRGDNDYEAQQQRISESAAAGVPNIGPSRGGAS